MELLRLEQQRQALEQSLRTLRASLKHWQTWEAEYEGLKEDVQATQGPLHVSSLTQISKDFAGELVDEKEIRDIGGLDKGTVRTAAQVVGIIERRQEYVLKNIETIQRQYWDAEAKLEELDFAAVSANRDVVLPLTEIHEELDDDDNVVSTRLSQPEASTQQLVETLRKAGVSRADLPHDLVDSPPNATSSPSTSRPSNLDTRSSSGANSPQQHTEASQGHSGPGRPPVRKKSVSFSADTKAPPEPVRTDSEDGKKTVSFASKVAVAPAALPPDTRSVSFAAAVEEIPAPPPATNLSSNATTKSDMQKNLQTMFKAGEKVGELNDADELTATHIVYPEGESIDDAQLRREMLNYHLHEVGHVVAQMDLDEGDLDGEDTASASDFASSEHADEDTPYTSGLSGSDEEQAGEEDDDEEEEDEYGRTKRRIISDDYHQEMAELQRRLIGNLGPAPSKRDIETVDPSIDADDVRRLVIRDKRSSFSSIGSDSEKKSGGRKRVSFAEALDVASPAPPPLKAAKLYEGENVPPAVESGAGTSHSSPHPGLAGVVIADKLTERVTPDHQAAPPAVDDPSTIMQRRELAAEYYRRRNEMIRQRGGFKVDRDEEEEHGELMEERDGQVKKVSRFKAARLNRP